MPRHDDPMESRRRRAAEEEAEALRAEVVRWVREGEAGREASEALRGLFRDGLEEAVHHALADGELARSLAEQVRGELAGSFEAEIRDEVARQVRAALTETLLSDAELEELRREVRQAVVTAVTAPDGARSRGGSLAGAATTAGRQRPVPRDGGTTVDGGAPRSAITGPAGPRRPTAPSGAYGRRPAFGGVDWTQPAVLGTIALAVVLGAAALWFFFLRGDGAAPDAAAGTAGPAAASEASPGDGGAATPGTSPSPDPAGDDNPLWDLYAARVAADYPAPAGLDARLHQRFDCWFSGAARDDLAEAVREAEAAAGTAALENRLRTVFPLCIGDDAVGSSGPGQGVNAAVFAAQAAAHRALTARAGRDWAGCRRPPSPAPDLAAFRADGLRGPGTYALLDALAACRGVGDAVSFDGSSDATDYLFVLYLALADLEGAA